ncbi:MAG TPA: hypothetical protein G4N96_14690, partial [Chloroflexi bacterium]|nr:hypothetical protein [Chloroflexota bacterium]
AEDETALLLPIVYEFYALSLRRADVRQIVSEHLRVSVDFIKEIFKQGVEKGELPPMDTEKAAMTFMTLLEGTIGQDFYSSDAVDTGEQLQFGVNLLLKGLQYEERCGSRSSP